MALKRKEKPTPLSADTLELIALRFKLLSEPMRLRILHELMAGGRTVSDLVGRLGTGQANISKHLGLLLQNGVLSRRKQGLNAYYEICDTSVFRLCDLVCGSLGKRLERMQELVKPVNRASALQASPRRKI